MTNVEPTTELLAQAVAAANKDREVSTAERLQAAQEVLEAAGVLCFGVECVSVPEQSQNGRELAYVNRGDTYDTTVIIEDGGEARAGSWGEWFEGAEADYGEENDSTRCAYCGEWVEFGGVAREDWRELVCPSCGHTVDGGEAPEQDEDEDEDED